MNLYSVWYGIPYNDNGVYTEANHCQYELRFIYIPSFKIPALLAINTCVYIYIYVMADANFR